MISDTIPKTKATLAERGIPDDSYFEVVFNDGSKVTEMETSWSLFSHKKVVDYLGNQKMCFVSDIQIKSIQIFLNGLQTKMEVPFGVEVYQFMRSERLVAKDTDASKIIGRGIGLIEDDEIIEERYIDAVENQVKGMRK
jgi:hypothetical protein